MKKCKLGILVCIVLIVLGVSVSYALWIQNLYQDDENTMATSCFSVSLEQANTISLKNAYPIYDEDGKKLTPYTFTIKNNCEAYATYQVNLEVLNSSTLMSPEFIKVMLDSHAPVLLSSKVETQKTIDNATTAYKLVTDGLDVNESKSYSLRLWIDEEVTLEDNIENSKFVAQIGITASYSEEKITAYDLCIQKYGSDSTQCQILLSESDENLCPTINSDGTVVRPSVATSQSLLCSAPDDYGTSYYFRGVPENNWVKFGGYYWRIIRINGDDSIRMIYAGDASVIDALDETTKATVMSNGYNDSSTQYTQIGTSYFNYNWKKNNMIVASTMYNDNAAMGYMYGNFDGIDQKDTVQRTTNFTMEQVIYVSKEITSHKDTNLMILKDPIALSGEDINENYIGYYTLKSSDKEYSQSYAYKITNISKGTADFTIEYNHVRYGTTSKEKAQTNTNDSDIKVNLDNWYKSSLINFTEYISDTLFCNDRMIINGEGYGAFETIYRWYSSSNGIRLTCAKQNDRFTVDDEIVGNGALTYPVGLLVADEAYLAGGSGENINYYLYTGNAYLTLSPMYNNGGISYLRTAQDNGYANTDGVKEVGVRPVINLKPNILKSGDGSATNPYTIVE